MIPTIFWALLAVTVAVGIGIGRFSAADSATPQHATHALVMRDELREALDHDELVLQYQPKIELSTGRVSCLEALVRWRHPERGLLMPAEFLPMAAQHSELMGSLTRWVLRRALGDYKAWTAVGRDWTVAVNISAADLGSFEFADTVGQILAEAGVRPDRLHLEATETELAFDTERAGQVIGALCAQGILMSINDFGSGFTSLSQLRTLQVCEVQIDRTFLAALPGNEQDRARVRSLIDLGHNLGCSVTAAGVEWQEVADWLVDAGCDHAQGYLWLRPRPWTEVAQVFGATTATTAYGAAATQSAPAPGKHTANFEELLEAMPDALVGVDRAGVIRFVNRQTELLFGYDRADLVGQSIETLVPESFREVHPAHRAGYFADPKARSMGAGLQLAGRRRDGTEFPVDISLSSVDTEDGLLVIAAVRDVTERNKADEGLQQLAAIIATSHDAIIGKTLDGIVTSWNPAAERMLGYCSEEIIGRSDALFIPKDRTGEMNARLARIRAGQQVEPFETIRVRKDGTVFPVSVTISPIHGAGGVIIGASTIARDATEQQRRFEAVERLAAVVEFSGEAIISSTLGGTITSWNPAAERLYGYSSQEIIGKPVIRLSPDDRTSEVDAILAKVGAGQPVVNFERIDRHKDGTALTVMLTISPICDADGTIVGMSAITCDATEARQAAEYARSLAAAEDLVRTVMASASIGIALADLEGAFLVVNRSLCDLLGYDEAYLLAHRLPDFVHPDDAEEALRARARVIAGSSDTGATKLRLVRADGATLWVRRVTVLLRDKDGEPDLLMVQVEDITAEHEAQEALTYQSFHDPLTGLHNRAWILDILALDLRAAKRQGRPVGALFVALDNFKVVNDSLGHAAGDEVLATVADRIVAALRPGDRVGRFGGDEFVIVVHDVPDVLEVERCAERVSASIAADLQVRGHRIVPTASIGIATSTSTSTPESLLRDADSALSRAKAAGRARWHFFDDAMHAQALARLTVEDELREAIAAGEFVVYYQPIVALADTRVVGHEALVRWAHPTRGLLSPGDFLEVAEDTGLITAVGAQVLDQACAMLAERPDLPGPISVNASAVQLAAPDWLTSVRDTLAAHRVDPARIVIEVTETAVLTLVDSARVALASLRRLGVGIHVDDFGTGYSSISVLRDLPVTGVKLDLRFVHDLTAGDSQANALAQGVSGLVNGMHLTGIAEGIETELQAEILRAQGWECGQGYYFGRPAAMPVSTDSPTARSSPRGKRRTADYPLFHRRRSLVLPPRSGRP